MLNYQGDKDFFSFIKFSFKSKNNTEMLIVEIGIYSFAC